ncbi:snRNA-activating protein complex subunit 2 isoform X2 [Hyperolius riggenbachi]|uniref:snRNA-activating protein complex subunit 2 isoform X2 n=1 Tax=Hyperolius riggenbachi TaxID=752182 RepID=UPI0035A3240A
MRLDGRLLVTWGCLAGEMKPPVRRRSAPSRFEVAETTHQRATSMRLAWSAREKIQLLKGLKDQRCKKVPEPSVRGRSQSEISSYIAWLRGRAAREAVQTEYENWVQERKSEESHNPTPIELWTDLLSHMSRPTEPALTSAFTQMLNIASTEPVTLEHSIPSKTPGRLAKNVLPQEGSVEEGPASSGEEHHAVNGAEDQWKELDFEKIYKYLSKAAKGETLPDLSACESAVLLHLLHCIPDQLKTLDAETIGVGLRKTYAFMNRRPESEGSTNAQSSSEPNWEELGICPLNPFLLPLELLKPKEGH